MKKPLSALYPLTRRLMTRGIIIIFGTFGLAASVSLYSYALALLRTSFSLFTST